MAVRVAWSLQIGKRSVNRWTYKNKTTWLRPRVLGGVGRIHPRQLEVYGGALRPALDVLRLI